MWKPSFPNYINLPKAADPQIFAKQIVLFLLAFSGFREETDKYLQIVHPILLHKIQFPQEG